MLAYKLTANINSDGTIVIPEYLRKLYQSQVEVILLVNEKPKLHKASINRFTELIDAINSVDEVELEPSTIYENRLIQNEREFIFD